MAMMGGAELLLAMLLTMGGSPDLASLLDPVDYFKQRGVEMRVEKLMELAATQPKDGGQQVAQLLALRVLGEENTKLKANGKYADYRQILEQIAEGTKAQDKQGFAKEYARGALLRLDGKLPAPVKLAANWRAEALGWFPSSATLVGAIDARASQPAGADREMQAMLAKFLQMVPVKERKKMYEVVDQIGNIQIQRIAFAYTDNPKDPRSGEIMLRVTGKADKARVIKMLTTFGLEAKEKKGKGGETYTLLTGGALLGDVFPPLLFIGENDLVLAGYANPFGKGGDNLAVLSKVLDARDSKKDTVLDGELKADLKAVPDKAVALAVGRVPEDLRKNAGIPMPLRFSAHAQPVQRALDVQFDGSFENAQQAQAFVQETFRGRTQALEELKNAQGQPLPIPGFDLAPIRQMLESLQVEGKDNNAKLRLLVPNQATMIAPLAFFVVRGGADLAPPEKEEKK